MCERRTNLLVYDLARHAFGEKELVDLTAAIGAINGWNRLAITFRTVPGTVPARRATFGAAAHECAVGI